MLNRALTRILGAFFLFGLLFAPSTLLAEDVWSAFRKIIPYDEQRDPLTRLQEAHSLGNPGRTELEQILKSHHATSLKSALQELDGLLNGYRSAITDVEKRFNLEQASLSELDETTRDYSRARLSVEELVALILFYKELQPRSSLLVENRGSRRADAEVARLTLNVTRFPYTLLRAHETGASLIPYSEDLKESWRATFKIFKDAGLRYEFNQIWAQMVHQNSGHLRFRHITGFEERFIWEVRRTALKDDEFRAQDLLVSYLANYATNRALDSVSENPDEWNEEQRKRLIGKHSEFLARFIRIKNRRQLREFFETGKLPPSFSEEFSSKQVNRILSVLAAASATDGVESCMSALALTEKYKKD